MSRKIITCEHCCDAIIVHQREGVTRIFAPCGCYKGGVVNEEVQ